MLANALQQLGLPPSPIDSFMAPRMLVVRNHKIRKITTSGKAYSGVTAKVIIGSFVGFVFRYAKDAT